MLDAIVYIRKTIHLLIADNSYSAANTSMTRMHAARKRALKAEFARWANFHPACRSTAFNRDSALHEYMGKRGIRFAGVDHLAHKFEAGTPNSETHLMWVLFSGRIDCDTGSGFRAMKPGDVAICPATHPHWLRLGSCEANGLWLHFVPDRRWARLAAVPPGVYSGLSLGHLRGLIEAYLTDLAPMDPAAIGAKIHAFELILFSVEQVLDQITGTKRHAFRMKIKTLEHRIQGALDADWTVSALAKEMNMSPSYLHKATLRHLGVKPMALVTKLRINHAMSRLLKTNMTLDGIADEVGYASPFAFSAAFKREVGLSPAQFRIGTYPSVAAPRAS
jgi:AraC-like DNA-binding protein/mannose-6-phosphate isomerase-like protein (cupin superfamily)